MRFCFSIDIFFVYYYQSEQEVILSNSSEFQEINYFSTFLCVELGELVSNEIRSELMEAI